jgi:thiol-disulfide isomerase/thioredoxin
MKKHLLIIITIFFFFSCEKQDKEIILVLNDIEEFPQEVIITTSSQNFVQQSDTISIKSEEDNELSLPGDRSKYFHLQKNGETFQLFLKPGENLSLGKKGNEYYFEGSLKLENSFLEEIKNNNELRGKVWDYDAPFDAFKDQVVAYFAFKKNLLDEYFPKKGKSYFYRLTQIEDQALRNNAILDHINTRSKQKDKDSLFFSHFDMELLNFKKMEPYIEAQRLQSFWSKNGVEFFMRKKYGEDLDSVRQHEEHYILRGDIISEYFDQPYKSMLIYKDLKYYPMEYDYAPDSLKLTSPREVLKRYKSDLSEEAYNNLSENLDKYEAKKNSYAKSANVPDFVLRDESNRAFEMNLSDSDKVVLIDIWASWCGPCIRSFPKVKKLEQQYSNQLEVVSISIDNTFDLYKEGLTKYEVPGELKLYAEKAFRSEFARYFQIAAIPRYILLDQNGNIIDANLNFSDIDDILKENLQKE